MQGKRQLGMVRGNANPFGKPEQSIDGGARPFLKQSSDAAASKATQDDVPWLLARMYAPSPIVNTSQSRAEGIGMVPSLYVQVGQADVHKQRKFGDKFSHWFFKGKFQ
jgi:hypothetical protein